MHSTRLPGVSGIGNVFAQVLIVLVSGRKCPGQVRSPQSFLAVSCEFACDTLSM